MPLRYLNRSNNSTTISAGNSVLFNGSSQYLTTATSSQFTFGTNNFTIEFWIKTTTTTTNCGFLQDNSIYSATSNWLVMLNLTGTSGRFTFWNANNVLIDVASTILNNNAWHHVAIVRTTATNITIFVDGTSIGSATISSGLTFGTGNGIMLGAQNGFVGARDYTGYISNLRIVKGTALYTSNFTPSTTPLTAITNTSLLTCNAATIVDSSNNNFISISTGAFPIYNTTDAGLSKTSGTRTDTNSSSLVLAIPMDGANNGTTFTDESSNIKGSGTAKTITNNGSIPTLTAISKFYGSSAYFSNAAVQSITFGNYGTDFQFTGDFTIECWVYPTTSGATDGSLFVLQSGGSNYFAFNFDPGTTFNIYNNSGGPSWSPSVSSVTTGRWNHFALVRSGNTQQIFVNGTSIGTNTASGTLGYSSTSADFARIGGGASGAINSYIQDFRVYKGVAKYTANFTPPADPNIITNNNAATVSSTVPFTASVVPAPNGMNFRNRSNFSVVSSGTQRAIFGYGSSAGGSTAITNLVGNTGVVSIDIAGVGTARGPAAASYGGDKAIFGYGTANGSVGLSITNLVSNTGVVATDTAGVGTTRWALAAASYGTDKAIFGYGWNNNVGYYASMTNKVSNTGVVATDTTGVGSVRSSLAAAGYGNDKAIFGYGYANAYASMTNLVSNTGVVANDTAGVGTGRIDLGAAGYGTDKAIFGYGTTGTITAITNLVSNTGVVANDTTGVGTARQGLASTGYGNDKAIFGYGGSAGGLTAITNLVSNTGVVATDTTGVGTARSGLAAAGYSNFVPAPNGMNFNKLFADPIPYMIATGGDLITTSGIYKIHKFTTVGTSSFTISSIGNTTGVEYLVVGGGGGGGGITNGGTGGGGGGQVIYNTGSIISVGIHSIIVGDGGVGGPIDNYGENGQPSHVSTYASAIGGGGGAPGNASGRSGANGGGGGNFGGGGGSTVGGFSGAAGSSLYLGGGGGGAGANGSDRNGGNGIINNILATPTYYGGGGAGGAYDGISTGGLGGGATNGATGTANTGGGGSGTQRGGVPLAGFKGGSGIVIIKYRYTT